MYRPFIDDPGHLRLLEGQRFVVIRPDAVVSAVHANARKRLERDFPRLPISYPREAHITLAGFPKGTELELIQNLVRVWSAQVSQLSIEVEAHDHFPLPAKIAIVRIRKTPDLIEALASLRRMASDRKLNPFELVPVEEWIFHMSVGYCSSLDDDDWAEVVVKHESAEVESRRCIAPEVEIAAFDNEVERSGGSYAFVVGDTK